MDTGADETYITSEMADSLGVRLLSQDEHVVETASGTMPVSYGHVELQLTDGEETYAWRLTVGIVPEPWPEAILGHVGFLQFFDTTFSYEHRTVGLIRNSIAFSSDAVH